MIKRIIAFSLFVVILLLTLYAIDNFFFNKEVRNVGISEYIGNRTPQFLSIEYFEELDDLFKYIQKDNGKGDFLNNSKRIAAKAILNKMMDDLKNNPNDLKDHKNAKRFFETFDKNIRKLDSITESMHFFRNVLNSYSGAPANLEDMIDLAARGEWVLFSARFHRFNYGDSDEALNIKFISADGRFEAVYNTLTGKIVTDPANMGTYNYAPGSMNPVKYYYHYKYDIKPWKKWGNVKGFSYHDIISLESAHGSEEAINNSKAVERLIKQKKDELRK